MVIYGSISWKSIVAEFQPKQHTRGNFSERDAESLLLEQSEMYGIMKTHFKSDFDELVKTAVTLVKSGAPENVLETTAANKIASIRRKYSSYVKFASGDTIKDMLQMSKEMYIDVFGTDGASVCNELAINGPLSVLNKSQVIMKHIEPQGIAYFEAVATALEKPAEYKEPNEADWAALIEKMKAQGAPNHYVDILANDDVSNPEFCPTLIALLEALISMPGEQGRRLRASFASQMAAS